MQRQSIIIAMVGCLLLLVSCLLLINMERRADSITWHQPYGGCKEASLYPGSQGYAECKAHGLLP